MDAGIDFVQPEFLHLLFFKQENVVIFPYVDLKHLRTLEIFTVGYSVVPIDATALHNVKEIVELGTFDSYAQSPNLYLIYNLSREKVEEIMRVERIRCILNTNEQVSDLASTSNFAFYNKKVKGFINRAMKDWELAFENYLISSSLNETILLDKIQKIKIVASQVFTALNEQEDLSTLPRLLREYERKYWQDILHFVGNYYKINVPDISHIRDVKDFGGNRISEQISKEYETMVSLNRNIGKEFVQQLFEYRSKKVNPSHLELQQLYEPLKLYAYLRERHWKDGIPNQFVQEWVRSYHSKHYVSEQDETDFVTILETMQGNEGMDLNSLIHDMFHKKKPQKLPFKPMGKERIETNELPASGNERAICQKCGTSLNPRHYLCNSCFHDYLQRCVFPLKRVKFEHVSIKNHLPPYFIEVMKDAVLINIKEAVKCVNEELWTSAVRASFGALEPQVRRHVRTVLGFTERLNGIGECIDILRSRGYPEDFLLKLDVMRKLRNETSHEGESFNRREAITLFVDVLAIILWTCNIMPGANHVEDYYNLGISHPFAAIHGKDASRKSGGCQDQVVASPAANLETFKALMLQRIKLIYDILDEKN